MLLILNLQNIDFHTVSQCVGNETVTVFSLLHLFHFFCCHGEPMIKANFWMKIDASNRHLSLGVFTKMGDGSARKVIIWQLDNAVASACSGLVFAGSPPQPGAASTGNSLLSLKCTVCLLLYLPVFRLASLHCQLNPIDNSLIFLFLDSSGV